MRPSGVPVLKENGSAIAGSASRPPSSDSGIVKRASIIDIVFLPQRSAADGQSSGRDIRKVNVIDWNEN
jgi:hypothetical protein